MKEDLAIVQMIHLVELRDHVTDAKKRCDVRVVIWLLQHRLAVLAKPYQRRSFRQGSSRSLNN